MEQSTGYGNEIDFLGSLGKATRPLVPLEKPVRSSGRYVGMTVIPWRDIWGSLALAKLRGHTKMIDLFYDTLFKEALFDDRGAWSPLIR